MKTFRLFTSLMAASLLLSSTAFAKKKPVDLSEFAGNYTGTGSLAFGGTVYPFTASTNFKPNKKGNSAVVTISGVLSASGSTIPLNETFTLSKAKTATLSDYIFGIGGSAYPTTGTYTVNKNTITYATVVTVEPTVAVTGTFKVSPKAKKQKLAVTLVVASAGTGLYTFAIDLTKQGK